MLEAWSSNAWTSVRRFWLCDSRSAARRRSSFAVVGTIANAAAALLTVEMEFCWMVRVVVVGMGSAEVVGMGVARKARLVVLRAATAPSRLSRGGGVLVEGREGWEFFV